MYSKISFFLLLFVVNGIRAQCGITDIKSLLEGCSNLMGLNVTSLGGTVVNDHNCDILLPKQVFAEEPVFQCDIADPKKFYALIMVDPDAPFHQEGEFYLHLLKSNIVGASLRQLETTKIKGVDYKTYRPPTPPKGSGVHRYMSLLYEQGDGTNFIPVAPNSRSKFQLGEWLRGKNLCGPIAATQFRTKF